MKKNMGPADKVIRTIVAIAITALFMTNVITGMLRIILLVLAGVFLLTSIIGFCPLYLLFGISTSPKTDNK